MQIWSQAYINEEDRGTCIVEEHTWATAHSEVVARRLIAEIHYGERVLFCAIGSPIRRQEGEGNNIYMPYWALNQLGACGGGEDVEVIWRSEEFFPEASRLVLRPRDSAFYHADAKEELERALTRIGVLQLGTTIAVALEALGGYEIEFDVIVTEPASIVLMQGDEVALEFEEALDGAAHAQAPIATPPRSGTPRSGTPRPGTPRPGTPRPGTPRPGTPRPEMFPMLPTVAAPMEPVGNVLGGETRRMADGRPWNPWR